MNNLVGIHKKRSWRRHYLGIRTMPLKYTLLRTVPGLLGLRNGLVRPMSEAAKWLLPSYRRWSKNYQEFAAQMPHIRDYEGAKPSLWLPFVMDSMEPNISTAAMNSDPMGFRYTIGANDQRLSPHAKTEQPVSLFVGGSTALGVGATSDRMTIPSLLAQGSGEPWYNLGVRGCTIAQNLIHFMIFRPEIGKVRRIVLFAGWNEVNGFIMSPLFTRYYGAFHGFMQYFQTMNDGKVDISRQEITFPKDWASLVRFSLDKEKTRPLFLEHMANTLDNWKFIADGLDAELIFIMQPSSFCCPHDLTEQEQRWFENKTNLAKLKRAVEPYTGWFADALVAECQRLGIPFRDCNKSFGKDLDRPLFIDPLHLTDQGNEEVVKIIDNVLTNGEN